MLRSVILLLLLLATSVQAQHVRLYAVVIGNDDPQNFMAGSSMGSGLWQSEDTGKTWRQLGWKHIKAYSMDHDSNGRVLYLAAGNGVLKSSDHGESWKVMTDWRVAEVMDVRTFTESLVIAATAHGVLRSTDAGASWHAANEGLRSKYVSRVVPFRSDLYACTEDGLYRSRDRGISWSRVKDSPPSIRAATPFEDKLLAAGDSGMVIFGGTSSFADRPLTTPAIWDAYYSESLSSCLLGGQAGVGEFAKPRRTHEGLKNVHAIRTIGDRIFAGTLDDGVWVKVLGEEGWRKTGLTKSQVWTLRTALIR